MNSTGHKKLIIILLFLLAGAMALVWLRWREALGIVVTPSTEPLVAKDSTYIPTDDHEQVLGNPGAPLTITLFADLGSARSNTIYKEVAAVVRAHPEAARLIWKDAPAQSLLWKAATLAHVGAYCAGQQQNFWPFVDGVLGQGKVYDPTKLQATAQSQHLNLTEWQRCLDGTEAKTYVLTGLAMAQALHLPAAPVLFVNNKRVALDTDLNVTNFLMTFIAP